MANWRDEMKPITVYKRKFAFLPKECADESVVWFKFYYSKFHIWNSSHRTAIFDLDEDFGHVDFVENITEAEYIVRRLTEGI